MQRPVVLTRALTFQLGSVLADARKAETEEAWRSQVVEPLRVTVSDLVSGIERRQRGMDAQQEEVRERIGSLLQEDWFAAVGDSEQLLNDTSTTLRELNEVLLRDSAHLQALLQDIEQVATEARADEAALQAQKVQEHLDRVTAWGGDRQRAWSDYYQFVQRYLRGVVRLDPNGVRIVAHLQLLRPDLVWAVPDFWGEQLSLRGLRCDWPSDLDLAAAPALVQRLAREGIWLEQEALALDPRVPGYLAELIGG